MTGSGGSGSCPYTKDNVSSGEYQVTIPMPSGTSAPYTVIMKFDADTTIVSKIVSDIYIYTVYQSKTCRLKIDL